MYTFPPVNLPAVSSCHYQYCLTSRTCELQLFKRLPFTLYVADNYSVFLSLLCLMVLFSAFHVVDSFQMSDYRRVRDQNTHTKICHFGMEIILNWRRLRNSTSRKSSLPCFLKTGYSFPSVKASSLLSPVPRGDHYHNQSVTWETKPASSWVCIRNLIKIILFFYRFPPCVYCPLISCPWKLNPFFFFVLFLYRFTTLC